MQCQQSDQATDWTTEKTCSDFQNVKGFPLLCRVLTGSGGHAAALSMGNGSIFLGAKAAEA